ncbi:TIR domain-containing protein [Viridibacillus arvi]|uniref:TIR domain-containing protein n=1 Tax=Viridibacillus arvi TaxID=263475 RepID=UPI003D2AD6A9
MQVFLSWSGSESKQIAEIFKDWLPNILQYTKPYMSAKDINLGERWNDSITSNLRETDFGLIFVTPSNINAPWINYEAGALSKTLGSSVIPILYNADVMQLQQGPLKQFQSARDLEKDSMLNLVKNINNFNQDNRLEGERLDFAFEMWWPVLEGKLHKIDSEPVQEGDAEEPNQNEVLSMIVNKLNEQDKLLNKLSSGYNMKNNEIVENNSIFIIREIELVVQQLIRCNVELEKIDLKNNMYLYNDINKSIKMLDKISRNLRN